MRAGRTARAAIPRRPPRAALSDQLAAGASVQPSGVPEPTSKEGFGAAFCGFAGAGPAARMTSAAAEAAPRRFSTRFLPRRPAPAPDGYGLVGSNHWAVTVLRLPVN